MFKRLFRRKKHITKIEPQIRAVPRKVNRGVLTTGQVAEIIGSSIHIVHNLFDTGKIIGFRVPGSRYRRITLETAIEFIANCPTMQERLLRLLEASQFTENNKISLGDYGLDALIGRGNIRFHPEQRLYTTGEAAALAKLSQRTIIRNFDTGRLQGHRIPLSRDRRITADSLARLLEERVFKIPEELIETAPYLLEYPGYWAEKDIIMGSLDKDSVWYRKSKATYDKEVSIRQPNSQQGLYINQNDLTHLILTGSAFRNKGIISQQTHLEYVERMLAKGIDMTSQAKRNPLTKEALVVITKAQEQLKSTYQKEFESTKTNT